MVSNRTPFLSGEALAGLVLLTTAALALVASNSGFSEAYARLWHTIVAVRFGEFEISKPLLLWVNDGLMAIFFFLVGLEVKREIIEGELSSVRQATLPVIAAIGGMAAPALIFLAVNASAPENQVGWAIPAATDIAFALGLLALLGSRVPVALKALLLAIAIIDDIGAILIIALFYTEGLGLTALGLAALAVAVLAIFNRAGMARKTPYVLVGIVLWVCVLKSGVHATLAGVITALAVPLTGADGTSPLRELEAYLHKFVTFLILPVFAFANAGVTLRGLSLDDLLLPLPLGIALGLVVGKQAGIFGLAALAIRTGIAGMPPGVGWAQLYGLSALAGIGFTMSLFIGSLAFGDGPALEEVKLGVLTGSAIAACLGCLVLWLATPKGAGRGGGASRSPVRETGQG